MTNETKDTAHDSKGQGWTTGPWTVNQASFDVSDCNGNVVAEAFWDTRGLPFHDAQNDASANANLIAAAPDMAEALERAETKLRAYVGVCKGDKELTEAILPLIAAALSKARGNAG